jgi:hypothetical protein
MWSAGQRQRRLRAASLKDIHNRIQRGINIMRVKTSLKVAIFASLYGINAAAALADETQVGCSNATLNGTYAFAGKGSNVTGTYQYSTSGMESYDGEGHLKWYQLWTDEFGTTTYSGTGTYTFTSLSDTSSGSLITAGCVAKVTYTGSSTWTYFVPPDGDAYYFSGIAANPLSAGKIERVSRALLVK